MVHKIYDCVMFNNETELLHTRIDYLYNVVDYFVICESKVSHSRKIIKEEFNFVKHSNIFEKYMDKIIFLPIEDFPFIAHDIASGEWKNENFQRRYLFNGFKDADPDDIIIISDLDEIPFDKTIQSAVVLLNNNEHLFIGTNQFLFYYYVNLLKAQIWQGSYITKKKYLGDDEITIKYVIQHIRDKRCNINDIIYDETCKNNLEKYLEQYSIKSLSHYIGNEIEPGGVHYSWLSNIIKDKFLSIAEHDIISEFNTDEHITNCVTNMCDLFNRDSFYGEQKLVLLEEHNSLSNINKMIDLYPYLMYKKSTN